MLLYVDDCLAISHNAVTVLTHLDNYFQMKQGSIRDPDIYLGAKLRQVILSNGVKCWGMSSAKYVQEAVCNVKDYITKNLDGLKLKKKAKFAWPSNYMVEDDESAELPSKLVTYYQHLIRILHWMVELGRVDIITEVHYSLLKWQCQEEDILMQHSMSSHISS